MSRRNNIILFFVLFGLIRFCTHKYIWGPGYMWGGEWQWLLPFSFLGVVLGFAGGTLFVVLGDLLTTTLLCVLINSLGVYPALKLKGTQPLTPLLALKMLGISIMYLSILVMFFFILYYAF